MITVLDFAVETEGAAVAFLTKWGCDGGWRMRRLVGMLTTPTRLADEVASEPEWDYRDGKLVCETLKTTYRRGQPETTKTGDCYEVWREAGKYLVSVRSRDLYKRLASIYWAPRGGGGLMPVKVNKEFTTTLGVVYAITAADLVGAANVLMDMARDGEI
jgi:hypothetical protein